VRETRTFTSKDDVLEIVDLLIEEAEDLNSKGQSFDIAKSVSSQIPFFACKNALLDRECQRDIQRYVYCKEFGVSPYEGDYSKHPAKWIDKSFIIKNAFAKMENAQIAKAKNNGSR